MDNPDYLETLATQDTRRRQKKTFDYTQSSGLFVRKQTQIRHDPSYKQLEVMFGSIQLA